MTVPKVSVIIPVYNVERYIEASLQSVVSQTLDNYEIIVIDDGSTDDSLKIVKKYMDKNNNIKLIIQENSGQSVARNKGIEVAQGKYIYFLDSDDYIDDDMLKIAYEESEKNKLDLLLFNGDTFFDEDYVNSSNMNINYEKKGRYDGVSNGVDAFIQLIRNKEYTCSPCLFLVRNEVLKRSGLNFYEGIIQEDELFTFELILQCERIKIIKDILFHRRVRASSTMSGENYYNSFMGYYVVLKQMISFRNSLYMHNQELENAIEVKLSYIYGSALNRYILLDKKEKRKVSECILEVNEIGKRNDYFHRAEYHLFKYSKKAYSISRNIYNSIKKITTNNSSISSNS